MSTPHNIRIMEEKGTLDSPKSKKARRKLRFRPWWCKILLKLDLGVKLMVGAWAWGWEEMKEDKGNGKNEVGLPFFMLWPKITWEKDGIWLIVTKKQGSWLVVGCVALEPPSLSTPLMTKWCHTHRRKVAESWPFDLGFSQCNFYWFGFNSLNYRNLADFLYIGKTVLRKFL